MSHMPRPAGLANLADLGRDCNGRALTATVELVPSSCRLRFTTPPVGVCHYGLINNVCTFRDHTNKKRARCDTEEHASTAGRCVPTAI